MEFHGEEKTCKGCARCVEARSECILGQHEKPPRFEPGADDTRALPEARSGGVER